MRDTMRKISWYLILKRGSERPFFLASETGSKSVSADTARLHRMSVPIGLIAITGRQKAIPERESPFLPPHPLRHPEQDRAIQTNSRHNVVSISFLCSCMTPIPRRGTFSSSSSSAAALHTDGQRKKTLFLSPPTIKMTRPDTTVEEKVGPGSVCWVQMCSYYYNCTVVTVRTYGVKSPRPRLSARRKYDGWGGEGA